MPWSTQKLGALRIVGMGALGKLRAPALVFRRIAGLDDVLAAGTQHLQHRSGVIVFGCCHNGCPSFLGCGEGLLGLRLRL